MTIPASIFAPAQLAYLLGIAAVLGASLGSFVTCLASRQVTGESALRGRSHCDSCGHVLGPLDLVPVVSWMALRGRCRYCGARMGVGYVLVELAMAALFSLLCLTFGFGVQTLALMALACVLLGASVVDLATYVIPNGYVVAGALVWVATVWFWPVPAPGSQGLGSVMSLVVSGRAAVVLDGVIGSVALGGFVLVASLAFDALTGKRSLGGGDVKLLWMVGLYLGVVNSFFCMFVACVLGVAFALVRNGSGGGDAAGEPSRTRAIPFGPAISAATMVAAVVGWQVVGWYVGLLW